MEVNGSIEIPQEKYSIYVVNLLVFVTYSLPRPFVLSNIETVSRRRALRQK